MRSISAAPIGVDNAPEQFGVITIPRSGMAATGGADGIQRALRRRHHAGLRGERSSTTAARRAPLALQDGGAAGGIGIGQHDRICDHRGRRAARVLGLADRQRQRDHAAPDHGGDQRPARPCGEGEGRAILGRRGDLPARRSADRPSRLRRTGRIRERILEAAADRRLAFDHGDACAPGICRATATHRRASSSSGVSVRSQSRKALSAGMSVEASGYART